jgi:hypothetical protein
MKKDTGGKNEQSSVAVFEQLEVFVTAVSSLEPDVRKKTSFSAAC